MIKKHLLTGLLSLVTLLLIASCGGQTSETEEGTNEEASSEQVEEVKSPIKSPRAQAEGEINGVKVVVDYGSPAVRNREIWGGLVPYSEVWRAGANETTSIDLGTDITLGDTKVKAGKYGLYIIPNENEDWVIIVNTDWNREEHGAWGAHNYTQDHDVARITVTPEVVDESQERLQYAIGAEGVEFSWEKLRLTIPIVAAAVAN